MQFRQLAFRQVSFYDDQQKPLLQPTDFEFPLNEVVHLHGLPGSGKSLVMRLMAGLLLPHQGYFEINGTNVTERTFRGFLPYRLKIGYSFEEGGLIGNKSVRQNLLLPIEYHSLMTQREADARVDELLTRFGLVAVQHFPPHALSSTHYRLAVVARALVLRPRLLLLDHPTTGLSNADRLKLVDILQHEKESGHIDHVFFISNQETFIDNITTARILIRDGTLIQQDL